MKKVLGWSTIVLALILVLLSGCHAAGPLKVGVVLPLTGDRARVGELQRNSFILAMDEINQKGGIGGQTVSVIIEDDNDQPDLARSAAEKLILEDGVLVLTGSSRSESGWEIAAVAEKKKVPFLITSSSADGLTERGWKYVFRICPPVSEYFKALLSFLDQVVKPLTLAVVHDNTSFGKHTTDQLAKAFKDGGREVVAREDYEIGATDFKPLLIRVRDARPDVVFMTASAVDAASLMRQSRELNLTPKVFVGAAQGFTFLQFMVYAGGASESVFSVDLWGPRLPYAGAQKYFDNYVFRYLSSTNYYGAQAYACMEVIADAFKRAKSLTPDGVRHAMVETDMETVFGPVRFVSEGKKTQQNSVRTFLGQWQGGVLETVWPPEFATGPYVYPVPPWAGKP
jgi:branched-chain amino acid transport system substrate-binding protein